MAVAITQPAMTITMAQPAIQFTVPAVRKSRSANITTPIVSLTAQRMTPRLTCGDIPC
jgi:hypothetical protein